MPHIHRSTIGRLLLLIGILLAAFGGSVVGRDVAPSPVASGTVTATPTARPAVVRQTLPPPIRRGGGYRIAPRPPVSSGLLSRPALAGSGARVAPHVFAAAAPTNTPGAGGVITTYGFENTAAGIAQAQQWNLEGSSPVASLAEDTTLDVGGGGTGSATLTTAWPASGVIRLREGNNTLRDFSATPQLSANIYIPTGQAGIWNGSISVYAGAGYTEYHPASPTALAAGQWTNVQFVLPTGAITDVIDMIVQVNNTSIAAGTSIKVNIDDVQQAAVGAATPTPTPAPTSTPGPTFTAVPASANGSVSIDTTKAVTGVVNTLFGANGAVFDGSLDTAGTTSFLRRANLGALRFPGGSTSDVWDWRHSNSQAVANGAPFGYVNSSETFTGTMNLLAGTGVVLWPTVNYGSGTPQEAADWVRAANVQDGYGIKNWEIGNEEYFGGLAGSGSSEVDNYGAESGTSFGGHALAFSQQMKAVDPSIKVSITLNVDEILNGNYSGFDGQAVKAMCGQTNALNNLDTLDIHPYAGQPNQESDPTLLAYPASKIPLIMTNTKAFIAATCPAQTFNVQIGETNNVAYAVGRQSVAMGDALFIANDALTWMAQGVTQYDDWALRDGPSTSGVNINSVGPFDTLYTDFGEYGSLTSPHYNGGTFPADYPAAGDVLMPKGAAEIMVGAFLGAGGQLITLPGQPANMDVHAIKRSDGSIGVLIDNQSSTTAYTLNLAFTGYTPTSATSTTYGPSQSLTQNGGPTAAATLSGVGANTSVTTQPYTIQEFNFTNGAIVTTATPTASPVPPTATSTATAPAPPTATATSTPVPPITTPTNTPFAITNNASASIGPGGVLTGTRAFVRVNGTLTLTNADSVAHNLQFHHDQGDPLIGTTLQTITPSTSLAVACNRFGTFTYRIDGRLAGYVTCVAPGLGLPTPVPYAP